ncbi:hypothetical protein CXG81DRAFT_4970, partial [Caulochytrium protostelioides]
WLLSQLRHRTYVKKDSKARTRFLKKNAIFPYGPNVQATASGAPARAPLPGGTVLPAPARDVAENVFWKVVDGMKIYKDITPGIRHRRHPTREHLHKGGAVKRLSVGKRSSGGRNATGRITVRGRGAGHKTRLRHVDLLRMTPGAHQIVRLEYDPNRTGELALVRNLATNEFSYILRTNEMHVNQIIYSWRKYGLPTPATSGEPEMPRSVVMAPGNCLPLADIPVGTSVCFVSLSRDGPARLCRAAGTYAVVQQSTREHMAQVKLSSGEVRVIPNDACATLGTVSNPNHHLRVWGKAGARRHKGFRPKVRGMAMAPTHHPHGGKKQNKGGKAPRSPWGWKTKGWK